jgi:type IV pilus assembly protein PilQ
VLGALFRSTTDTNDKDELLIFVTPKILREGINVN